MAATAITFTSFNANTNTISLSTTGTITSIDLSKITLQDSAGPFLQISLYDCVFVPNGTTPTINLSASVIGAIKSQTDAFVSAATTALGYQANAIDAIPAGSVAAQAYVADTTALTLNTIYYNTNVNDDNTLTLVFNMPIVDTVSANIGDIHLYAYNGSTQSDIGTLAALGGTLVTRNYPNSNAYTIGLSKAAADTVRQALTNNGPTLTVTIPSNVVTTWVASVTFAGVTQQSAVVGRYGVGVARYNIPTSLRTGTSNADVLTLVGSGTGSVSLRSPVLAPANVTFTLPATLPSASGQVLTSDVVGNLSWGTDAGGTVKSVALSAPTGLTVTGSPITDSGTLSLGWDASNRIPTSSLGSGTASESVFLAGDGTWKAVSGASGGTVTSVGVTAPTGFTVTGSPVTGAGTLGIAFDSNATGTKYLRGDGVWDANVATTTSTQTLTNKTLTNPSIQNAAGNTYALPTITANQTLLTTADKGAANGVAPLGSNQKIDISYIPSLAIVDFNTVANQAARLALTNVNVGDWAIQEDNSTLWILNATDAQIASHWTNVQSVPGVASLAINGGSAQTGAVAFTETQSDWNQTSTTAVDYIKNKPTIPVLPVFYTGATASTNGLATTAQINAVISGTPKQGDYFTDTRTSALNTQPYYIYIGAVWVNSLSTAV